MLHVRFRMEQAKLGSSALSKLNCMESSKAFTGANDINFDTPLKT